MARTLYAQLVSSNIDADNQWNTESGGGGDNVPFASIVASEDTLEANGKTVSINVSVDCVALTTANGGGLTIADGGWNDTVDDSSNLTFDEATQTVTSSDLGVFSAYSAGTWVWLYGSTNRKNNGFKYITNATGDALTFGADLNGKQGIHIVDESPGTLIFLALGGIIIDADIAAGISTCLISTVYTGNALLIIGDIAGSSTTNSRYGYLTTTGGGFVTFIGDVISGTGGTGRHGYVNTGTSHASIIGSLYGSSSTADSEGAVVSSTGYAAVHGNIINLSSAAQKGATIYWQPAFSSNYIQFPDGSGGTIKAYAQPHLATAGNVLEGVTNGPYTGTLAAPDAPTLSVSDDEDGSVTASVTGTGTIQLYYRIFGDTDWATGESRSGDGDISQTGLTQGRWYEFYATATVTIESAPSNVIRLLVASGSTPVIEAIASNIAAAIGEITVDNGFAVTLTAVRPRRLDFMEITLNDGLVFIWQGNSEEIQDAATGSAQWITTFDIGATMIDSESETASIDTTLNTAAAAIEQKLKEDPTRGGFAIDCLFPSKTKIDDAEATTVVLQMAVHWRHEYDDPYTEI